MTALDRETKVLALTYKEQLTEIEESFVDRREAVGLLGIGALCHEHVLVIGPPGTAKTRLLERFCRMLESKPFTYLLTRFTEPAELFGPIDVESFQVRKRYEINTDGMLPRARFAFLDEVFQGSSAILNTLLTLINERTFNDGRPDSDGSTPLITLVGSSNDIPSDPVLAAFSDRFLLRCQLNYVAAEQIEDVLLLGWKDEQERIRGLNGGSAVGAARTQVTISPAQLNTLQQKVAEIDLSPIYGRYLDILRTIRTEGITFSDRRAVKAQKVFAASALLEARGAADIADLRWLTHLWTDPRDEKSLHRIVADHGVPVAEPGGRVRQVHEILEVDLTRLQTRRTQVGTEREFRELIRDLHRLIGELHRDHPEDAAAMHQVRQEFDTTIAVFRERFPWEGVD